MLLRELLFGAGSLSFLALVRIHERRLSKMHTHDAPIKNPKPQASTSRALAKSFSALMMHCARGFVYDRACEAESCATFNIQLRFASGAGAFLPARDSETLRARAKTIAR
jgi:hypothetical protein